MNAIQEIRLSNHVTSQEPAGSLGYVFDDVAGESDTKAQQKKRECLRMLDHETLLAYSALFRLRDVESAAVSTIRALCTGDAVFTRSIRRCNDIQLWIAALGVVSSSDEYWKFRKGTLHTSRTRFTLHGLILTT